MRREAVGHGHSFPADGPGIHGLVEGKLRRHACESKEERVNASTPARRANLRLLAELQADARLSFAELGRRVGLSPPAVAERVGRLEEGGVITGYRAEVDPRAVGCTLGVVIRIRPAPRELQKVAELAQRTPEVVECHRITGDDCYFMKRLRARRRAHGGADRPVRALRPDDHVDRPVVAGAAPACPGCSGWPSRPRGASADQRQAEQPRAVGEELVEPQPGAVAARARPPRA